MIRSSSSASSSRGGSSVSAGNPRSFAGWPRTGGARVSSHKIIRKRRNILINVLIIIVILIVCLDSCKTVITLGNFCGRNGSRVKVDSRSNIIGFTPQMTSGIPDVSHLGQGIGLIGVSMMKARERGLIIQGYPKVLKDAYKIHAVRQYFTLVLSRRMKHVRTHHIGPVKLSLLFNEIYDEQVKDRVDSEATLPWNKICAIMR